MLMMISKIYINKLFLKWLLQHLGCVNKLYPSLRKQLTSNASVSRILFFKVGRVRGKYTKINILRFRNEIVLIIDY